MPITHASISNNMKPLLERLDAALAREGIQPGTQGATISWTCPKCKAQNKGKNRRCHNCRARSPKNI